MTWLKMVNQSRPSQGPSTSIHLQSTAASKKNSPYDGLSFRSALRPHHGPQFRHGEGLAGDVIEIHHRSDVLEQQD